MHSGQSTCSMCGGQFEVRFRYQVEEIAGQFRYLCSQFCQQRAIGNAGDAACSVCRDAFVVEFPFQTMTTGDARTFFCSMTCRASGAAKETAVATTGATGPRRIAVFNHKGGTGKTTTAVNLAAGIAQRGSKVLLIDADGQGNVGASLGVRGEHTLYDVLVHGLDAREAAVPIRPNLDVLTSNEALAAAELHLATRPNRDRIMRERLGERVSGYDVVVIDCAPALSLMNQNVLVYADSVVVPVSCDYLALVGVRQVLKTLKNVRELLSHHVEMLGVLPTFYDVRNRISREAVAALVDHFGERCLPPIRVNTKLKEAPAEKLTIFEYAPESNGARDYLTAVERIVGASASDFEVKPEATESMHVFARPAGEEARP